MLRPLAVSSFGLCSFGLCSFVAFSALFACERSSESVRVLANANEPRPSSDSADDRAPSPAPAEETVTSPPWPRAIPRAIVRPIPDPADRRGCPGAR